MIPDDLTPSPAAQWAAIVLFLSLALLVLIGAATIVEWML